MAQVEASLSVTCSGYLKAPVPRSSTARHVPLKTQLWNSGKMPNVRILVHVLSHRAFSCLVPSSWQELQCEYGSIPHSTRVFAQGGRRGQNTHSQCHGQEHSLGALWRGWALFKEQVLLEMEQVPMSVVLFGFLKESSFFYFSNSSVSWVLSFSFLQSSHFWPMMPQKQ